MRSIDTWLDRFCYKHPRFGIPNLMTIIVAGNVLVYLLDMFSMGRVSLSYLLAFIPEAVLHGQIWRLVTFVFVPSTRSVLLLVELYFYWFIGSSLEREWGTTKFTVFYIMGLLLNIVVGMLLGLFGGGSLHGHHAVCESLSLSLPLPRCTRTSRSFFSSSSPSR